MFGQRKVRLFGWMLPVLIIVALPGLAGCEQDADKPRSESFERMKREVSEGIGAISDYSFEKKDELVETLREKLENHEETVEELKQEASQRSGEAKKELEEKIELLQKKGEELRGELRRVASGGGEAWKQLRQGLDNAWREYNKAYEEAEQEADGP